MRPSCPLCQTADAAHFHRDASRDYYRCAACHVAFVPPDQFLSAAQEKARYDLHTNSPADQGYRDYLGQLVVPMAARLRPNSRGLDFGSGPGPTLSLMFEELGHRVALYDPFYAPDESVLTGSYDFITASEVVEHLREPRKELDRLWSILRPGGWLGIMTQRLVPLESFAAWHYKNDLTHVVFYWAETFRWLARRWNAELSLEGPNVAILQKLV